MPSSQAASHVVLYIYNPAKEGTLKVCLRRMAEMRIGYTSRKTKVRPMQYLVRTPAALTEEDAQAHDPEADSVVTDNGLNGVRHLSLHLPCEQFSPSSTKTVEAFFADVVRSLNNRVSTLNSTQSQDDISNPGGAEENGRGYNFGSDRLLEIGKILSDRFFKKRSSAATSRNGTSTAASPSPHSKATTAAWGEDDLVGTSSGDEAQHPPSCCTGRRRRRL